MRASTTWLAKRQCRAMADTQHSYLHNTALGRPSGMRSIGSRPKNWVRLQRKSIFC